MRNEKELLKEFHELGYNINEIDENEWIISKRFVKSAQVYYKIIKKLG